MRVRELMSRPVVTVTADASCHEAVTRMCRHRVRHLPVVAADGRVVGVVTDRDLRHHLFAPDVFARIGREPIEGLLRQASVGHVMSRPAVWIDAGADAGDAAALMRSHKVGSLPVVDEGRVVGILTEIDLLRHICCEPGAPVPPELDVVVSYP
jgi:acetoin utilization protein AcuB